MHFIHYLRTKLTSITLLGECRKVQSTTVTSVLLFDGINTDYCIGEELRLLRV